MKFTITQQHIDIVENIKWSGESRWANAKDDYRRGSGDNNKLHWWGALGEIAAVEFLRASSPEATVTDPDLSYRSKFDTCTYDIVHSYNDINTYIDVKCSGLSGIRCKQEVVYKLLSEPLEETANRVFMVVVHDGDRRMPAVGDTITFGGWCFAEELCHRDNERAPRDGRKSFMNFELPQEKLRQFKNTSHITTINI